MKLPRYLLFLLVGAGACLAQLPDCYKRVDRVTWLVKSLDRSLQGWRQFGLAGVREQGEITIAGQYRGHPVTIRARSAIGSFGNFTVDMLQPAAGENAFSEFLARHGDGIFSIVYRVAGKEEMTKEIARLHGLGVGVLQRTELRRQALTATSIYFDTEREGKYVLGLIDTPESALVSATGRISHIGLVARQAEQPSAFWQKLGFPAMPKSHASPRADSRYHERPLWLDFDVCWQRHSQVTFEWIIPPADPPNLYADYLHAHGEGVQHLGVPVEDLDQSIAAYGKLGYTVAQSGAWGETGKKGSGRYAYLDTDSIGGVVAEIIRPIN